jgi:hypothetical protein
MVRTQAGWAIRAAFALSFCFCTAPRIDAECLISTADQVGSGVFATPTAPLGQSFIACEDGMITNIAVWVGLSTLPQYRFGLRQGTDILVDDYVVTGSIPTGAQRLRFTPMYPVTKGTVYSLSLAPITGSLSLPETNGTSYPDGSTIAVVQGASVPRNTDLIFAVTITDGPVPAAAATWGKIKSTYR